MSGQLVIYTSMKIFFVWAAMQRGMVLYPLRIIIEKMISIFPATIFLLLRKPLFDCLFCMSSFWGTFFLTKAFSKWNLVLLNPYGFIMLLLCIGTVNWFVEFFINKMGYEGEVD
jgi:hypothetical protein